jgi:hypothetical protein
VFYDPSDLTTLFQDSAGTTPVTAPNQTVGLMLDKSQGLVLGSELVTNGTFTDGTTTGWTSGSTVSTASVVDGEIQVTAVSANGRQVTAISTVIGKTYRVTGVGRLISAGGTGASLYQTSSTGVTTTAGNINSTSTNVPLGLIFTATATTSYISALALGGAGTVAAFDNISVKELAGNHATQATSTQRPIYGINPITGTRNLLTYTEQFDNAVWTKSNSAITANADGVADLVYPLTSGTLRGVERSLGAVSSAAHTTSIEAKASGLNFLYLYGAQGNSVAYFNLSTGAVGTVGSGLTATITNVGGGYYRCTVTQTVTVLFIYAGGCDANGSTQATASGTSGILIRNIQLEAGTTATAYQKVVTQYEVTEAGVQSVSYIAFDGVDDSMVTGTITPGIDKAQVFAGVRKLSDVTGIIAETGTTSGSLGAFYFANDTTPSANFSYAGRGGQGGVADDVANAAIVAPTTAVLTAQQNINGGTPATIRRNGVLAGSSVSTTFGGGNFRAYPLYIGRRGGTTLPFNGRIYQLIVRFGPNLNSIQISNTERYINNRKTGAY